MFAISDPLPTGTTLLEASAGTGKTWTIASLVTRFVAEGRCRLDEMLVVTFGRAASQELRQRVREQLVAASRVLSGTDAGDGGRHDRGIAPLVELLLDGDAQELAARHRRLREALAGFDGATIATTHQFCHQVLESLGVAGDTDQRARLVEDLDDLLVEVVDDLYVADHAGPGSTPAGAPDSTGAGAPDGLSGRAGPPVRPARMTRAQALDLARDVVSDPQARLEPQDAPYDSPAGARVDFATRVRAELDRRKQRLGVLGYDDLLSQLASALALPDAPARHRMRERWKVVLVDEFQDTDPVQWQVLDRAFSGHATMVLIGDPKQAIYAFRGGDVVTYLQAAATAADVATLGTNQRSDETLLASLQALLRGSALGDPAIVVRAVDAAHGGTRLVGAPHPAPFRLRLADRYTMGVDPTKTVPVAELRQHVADDLAQDVAALLGSGATFDGRPLLPRDVAVLCRTTAQCHGVQAALERAGVRCVFTGSGSVFRPDAAGGEAQAASAWLALLEAMEQPHRTGRVHAAALTPFFGHTATSLDAGGDRLTDELADRLRDWGALLRARGVAAVHEVASADGQLATRVLAVPGGERLMTDLRHAGEALHAASSRDRLSLVALIRWLREQMSDEHLSVASERARRLDSDASAVQILTVHVSKGLQFPVVYLPGMSDLFVGDTPRTLHYHDDDGLRCLDVSGDPTGAVVERVRHEELTEELRVLYVALTRAQSQVVAWWFPSPKNTASSPLHRVVYGRGPGVAEVPDRVPVPDDKQAVFVARQWEGIGGPAVEPARITPAPAPATPSAPEHFSVRSFTRDVDHTWTRTSYSALTAAAAAAGQPEVLAPTSEPEDLPRDDEPPVEAVGSAGPALATGSAGSLSAPGGPDREEPGAVVADPGGATLAGAEVAALRSPMADLPVGATFGSLVHGVLEHADPEAPDRGGDWRAELTHHVHEQLVRWPVPLDETALEQLVDALVAICDTPLGPLASTTLRALPLRDRLRELDFELPLAGGDDRLAAAAIGGGGTLRDVATLMRRHLPAADPMAGYADVVDDPSHEQALRGYLSGSIDLVLRLDGRYVVVDYKTNWLGDLSALTDPSDLGDPTGVEGSSGLAPETAQGRPRPRLTTDDYRPDRLATAMSHSSYPLQAMLYAVVLHRFLRWRQPGYDPHVHLGGVLYLYVRGMAGPQTPVVDGQPCGVFAWRPPVALVEELSDLLDGVVPGPPAAATAPTGLSAGQGGRS